MNNVEENILYLFSEQYFEKIGVNVNEFINCIKNIYDNSNINNYVDCILRLKEIEEKFHKNELSSETFEYKICAEYFREYKDNMFVVKIKILNDLIKKVETEVCDKVILYDSLYTNNKNKQGLNIKYDENHKIVTNVDNRCLTLICLFVMMYSHLTKDDVLKFVNEFYNGEFEDFHNLIHSNIAYSTEDVEEKIQIIQAYVIIKSLVIMYMNIDNKYICVDIIKHKCDYDCVLVKTMSDIVLSNVILSSIYLFRMNKSDFNDERYQKFVNRFTRLIVNLGLIYKSRCKYNIIYAFSLLLSIKYMIVNESLNMDEILYKNDSKLETYFEDNNAFCFKIDKKIIVIEMQSDGYVIYDVYGTNNYNVRNIFYTFEDLNEFIKNNKPVGKICGGVSQNDISQNNIESLKNKILGGFDKHNHVFTFYLFIIIVLLVIIIVIYERHEHSIEHSKEHIKIH